MEFTSNVSGILHFHSYSDITRKKTEVYQSIFTATRFVIYFIFIFMVQQPKVGQGPLFVEVPQSHTHTHTHTHTHIYTQAY